MHACRGEQGAAGARGLFIVPEHSVLRREECSHALEEDFQPDAERPRDALDRREGHVLAAVLDGLHMLRVDGGALGDFLLRQATLAS